jgi:hypothetical protein
MEATVDSKPIRYELTPEISKDLISLLNGKGKRAPVFRDAKRQKVFLIVVGMIAREVERTGGVYPDNSATDLRRVQVAAQQLQAAISSLSSTDSLTLFMMYWSLGERQRKALPVKARTKVPVVRFRVTGPKSVVPIESQQPLNEPATESQSAALHSDPTGWDQFSPNEIASMLSEAAERLTAQRAGIPSNRRYPEQPTKSRMFIRMLVPAYIRAFGKRPTGAKDGYFGSIVNNLLRAFGEKYEAGQATLNTIINEETKGFQGKERPKPR